METRRKEKKNTPPTKGDLSPQASAREGKEAKGKLCGNGVIGVVEVV